MTNNTGNSQQLYTEYTDLLQKAADLHSAAAVLEWDQETYMPAKGAEFRGRQLATLAAQAHDILTSPRLEDVLAALSGRDDLTDEQKANVRISVKDMEKNKKLPSSFVEALSKQSSECFNAWIQARQKNDYSIFAPSLMKMIQLKQEQARLYGYTGHPYDALLDDYEPGATVAMLDKVFDKIKIELPQILDHIKHTAQVSNECFHKEYPKALQWDFSVEVLRKIGYDFDAGRQDYAEHPFTTSFSSKDVRITTRVDEHNYASLLWSTIHEGGHALYEQGLPEEQYGLPLGAAASLGIHESQSRLWENCIGRNLDTWKYFFPVLKQHFPTQLADVTAEEFFKAMNRVEPSFIRTEADEVTYHFHVMIRYEIEKGLLDNTIDPAQLPAIWNGMYEKYLGITPPNDTKGILQDVHWSHGSFGYFPTYSLGSFYAAQFFARAHRDINGLDDLLAKGEFMPLLAWLREQIHQYGRRFTSEELCERVTGEKLDTKYFMQYIRDKYVAVYG